MGLEKMRSEKMRREKVGCQKMRREGMRQKRYPGEGRRWNGRDEKKGTEGTDQERLKSKGRLEGEDEKAVRGEREKVRKSVGKMGK